MSLPTDIPGIQRLLADAEETARTMTWPKRLTPEEQRALSERIFGRPDLSWKEKL